MRRRVDFGPPATPTFTNEPRSNSFWANAVPLVVTLARMKNESDFFAAMYYPGNRPLLYILPQKGGSAPPDWGQSSYFDHSWDAQPSQPAGYLRLADYSAKRPQIAKRYFSLALILDFSTPNLININFLGSIMRKKFAFGTKKELVERGIITSTWLDLDNESDDEVVCLYDDYGWSIRPYSWFLELMELIMDE